MASINRHVLINDWHLISAQAWALWFIAQFHNLSSLPDPDFAGASRAPVKCKSNNPIKSLTPVQTSHSFPAASPAQQVAIMCKARRNMANILVLPEKYPYTRWINKTQVQIRRSTVYDLAADRIQTSNKYLCAETIQGYCLKALMIVQQSGIIYSKNEINVSQVGEFYYK